jgi:hypothetical protein
VRVDVDRLAQSSLIVMREKVVPSLQEVGVQRAKSWLLWTCELAGYGVKSVRPNVRPSVGHDEARPQDSLSQPIHFLSLFGQVCGSNGRLAHV